MKHTILIIDDDILILNTLQKRFSTWQIDVHGAHSPEDAKQLMEKYPPDLVILDLLLTKGDGAEDVLDFMKTKPNLEQVPVIVLTNLEKPELKDLLIGQGVKEYLIKGTVGLDELYEKVLSYLEPKS